MHMGTSVQYRLVDDLTSPNGAVSTEPGLEDSYVLLMREKCGPGLFVTRYKDRPYLYLLQELQLLQVIQTLQLLQVTV